MLNRTESTLRYVIALATTIAVGSCSQGKLDSSLSTKDESTAVDDAGPFTPSPSSETALAILSSLRARFGNALVPLPGEDESDASRSVALNPLAAGLADGFEAGPGGLRPVFRPGTGVQRAHVLLSPQSTAPFNLKDTVSGMSLEVSLEDAREAAAGWAEGFVVYPRGHASGATLLHRALEDGTEDFFSFDDRPNTPGVKYRVTLRSGVAGLRLVANTLEMLDATGTPRLRVAPPYLVSANQTRTDATLAVEGCAFDSNPAAPWGRAVTAPGADACTVRVTWPSEGVVYPALLDPRWTTTGSMSVAREEHTATVLSTGRVLVVGGTSGSTTLATAELYDRTTGTWAATNSLTGARKRHTAVQLGTSSNTTTSGKVLIAGGTNGSSTLSTAQLYSPTAGTWVAAANMNTARNLHTATLLANGRVLVAGGMNGSTVLGSAATYNPASGSGSWTAVGSMSSGRRYHSATLLATSNPTLNNKVLVVGGNSGSASLKTVQLFDGTSSWSTLTALSSARQEHTATLLSDGRLLVAGGKNGSTTLASTLLFNPASGTGSWTSGGTMQSARHGHSATLLSTAIVADGQLLVAGGWNGSTTVSSAELFNGVNAWTLTKPLPSPSKYHTASVLGNGVVLIAGGVNGSTTLRAAHLYDPSLGVSCTSGAQCSTGFCAHGVCCDTACTEECAACNLPGLSGICSAKPSGTACSDDGNICSVDTCDGASFACQHPAGNVGAVCRPQATNCDIAESCTGSSTACPADELVPDGTTCDDGNACTLLDRCTAGACVGNPFTCSGHGICTSPPGSSTPMCECDPGYIGDDCSIPDPVADITPTFQCVFAETDGSFRAVFGYANPRATNVAIPIGPSNRFVPGNPNQGQPTNYVAGGRTLAFIVGFDGNEIRWRLGGGLVAASSQSTRCPTLPPGTDTGDNGSLDKFPPSVATQELPLAIPVQTTSNSLSPLVTDVPVETQFGPPVQELIKKNRGDRAVEVVLTNGTSAPLVYSSGLMQGAISTQPPRQIEAGSYGTWESRNGIVIPGQGTGGHMVYAMGDGNFVRVDWNNPFIGTNSYSGSVTGPTSGDYIVDAIDGEGNKATVFFNLRRRSDPYTSCPGGSFQWIIDNLRSPEAPLGGISQGLGFVTTPLKRVTGVQNWSGTGCHLNRGVGTVAQIAYSTDGFWTIDVMLDEFRGALLSGMGKAVRLEVDPIRSNPGDDGNAATRAILNSGPPKRGDRIVFSGDILLDHGSFLEVHPTNPLTQAPNCNTTPPPSPTPLYCNAVLNDAFTWTSGMAPVPMGRAGNRACFLTTVAGVFADPTQHFVHAMVDPNNNNWFLTGSGLNVRAVARCISVDSVSSEKTWSSGQSPVFLDERSGARGCYLTRVGGAFDVPDDEVEISTQGAINLYLDGDAVSGGVNAAARCITITSANVGHQWVMGQAAKGMKWVDAYPACFFVKLFGGLNAADDRVDITPQVGPDGFLWWVLGGRSTQNGGLGADSECLTLQP